MLKDDGLEVDYKPPMEKRRSSWTELARYRLRSFILSLTEAGSGESRGAGSGSWRVDDEHGGSCVRNHGSSNAAEQVPHKPASAVGADHNQARVAFRGGVDDPLPGRCRLDGQALRRNPAFSASDASVCGGLLRCPSDFCCLVGVKMALAGGHESDIDRLPHTEDQCFSAGRKLPCSLIDSECRKF